MQSWIQNYIENHKKVIESIPVGKIDRLIALFKEANREHMVITQIETMEAVENLKETLTVPGIDVVFIGPNDLSAAMGYPGQVKHPEVQEMIDHLVKEIRTAGKALGTVAYDLDTLRQRKEQGFQFIVYSIVPMIVKSGREYLQVARE